MRTHLLFLSLLTSFAAAAAGKLDIRRIEQELTTSGAVGWIHGSIPEKNMYVFTYRNPEDFFDYIEMSLVATDSATAATLATFKRHDKVRVIGNFLPNPSPQKHIAVRTIELVKKYEPAYPSNAFDYDAAIPDELKKKSKAGFLVHAVAGEGRIVVAEYKDAVLPIYAPDNSLTKALSRNDIIRLCYVVRSYPGQPVHLEIDTDAKKPLEIIESIRDIDGKPASVEGALVLFPKSPEISLNVFAVLEEKKGGFNRQFTIVNFEKPEVFKAMRDKLQAAWDKYPGEYVNGRNKLVSKRLRVRVKGVYNQVAVNQANPQVLISSADDVEIIGE